MDLRLKYGPDYYKKIRGRVASHPGGSFRDPEAARAAQLKSVEARQKNKEGVKRKQDGKQTKESGRPS